MEKVVPQFKLNGLPFRPSRTFSLRKTKTFPSASHYQWDLLPTYEKCITLGRLLNKCISDIAGSDEQGGQRDGGFLPPALLGHFLSRNIIEKELNREGYPSDIAKTLDILFQAEEEEPEESSASGGTTKAYLTIFALLARMTKVCDIAKFIGEDNRGVCDQDLPLRLIRCTDGRCELRLREEAQQRSCFNGWTDNEREIFDKYQWQMLVPRFYLDASDTIRHEDFPERIIFPWCEETSDNYAATSGGYGRVKKVKIHPLCHEFHEILKAINVSGGVFAVKTLKHTDAKKFEEEVRALKRFNGLVHKHLVTLLGTFTHKSYFSMIFPSAECDVEEYWETINPKPNQGDVKFVHWLSEQCRGIMEAVDKIHNPKYPANLPKETLLYGRHGDIKPENILWYKSLDKLDRGIWVLSDLGFTTFNREKSRSMVPRESVLATPGYRPPECDLDGGQISRAFDIWTLGCFYLEMICWFLDGWTLKDKFQKERTTNYIMGSAKDIFFDLQVNKDDKLKGSHIAFVKPVVTKKINALHNHQNCTDYIHNFLDLIEQGMIVVLSVDRHRMRSPDLLKELNKMHNQCIKEHKYCMEKTPSIRPYKDSAGTEATLNDVASDWAARTTLEIYVPPPGKPVNKSLTRKDFENVDRLGYS